MDRMHRTRVTALGLAVTMALVVASCGGGDGADKAGGSRAPLVLRLANTNGMLDFTPAVADFAERVKESPAAGCASRR
jgi:hypothetical protein